MRRLLGALGLQALLLTLAVLGARMLGEPASGWKQLFRLAPWLTAGAGLVLSWRFGRGRLFTALLLVGALTFVLPARGQLGLAVAVLVPLNLAVLALLPERAVLSVAGLTRVGLLAAQAMGLVWLLRSRPELIENALASGMLRKTLAGIALPALLAFLFALVAGGLRLWRGRQPADAGLVGCVLACCLALGASDHSTGRTLYLTAAALALVVAAVEDVYGKAYMDELTGLPGRRALVERLSSLGRSYAIAMVDVDHFKRFNDRLGHDAGDQALSMVASQLSRVGGGGRSYRYGGEEFTVVFPGKEVGDAVPRLESLRESIADAGFTPRAGDRPKRKPRRGARRSSGPKKVKLTVSIGVAERSERLATPQAVLQAADKALYRAKKKGRNRVSR